MTDAPTLKPCPFCGGTDLHQYDDEAHTNWIRCMDCGAGTDQGFAHQVAEWWNRRAIPADDAEMVERVARALCAEWSKAVGLPTCGGKGTCHRCLGDARAALSAMRGEP